MPEVYLLQSQPWLYSIHLPGFHLRLWGAKWSGLGHTPGIQYLAWQRFKPGFVHKRSRMNIRGDLKFSKCKGKSKQVGWLMHWFAKKSPNCYHLHGQQQFHWMCPATWTQKSSSTGPHHVNPEPDLTLFLLVTCLLWIPWCYTQLPIDRGRRMKWKVGALSTMSRSMRRQVAACEKSSHQPSTILYTNIRVVVWL